MRSTWGLISVLLQLVSVIRSSKPNDAGKYAGNIFSSIWIFCMTYGILSLLHILKSIFVPKVNLGHSPNYFLEAPWFASGCCPVFMVKLGVDFLLRSLHIKYWSDLGGGLEWHNYFHTQILQHVLAKWKGSKAAITISCVLEADPWLWVSTNMFP